MTLKPEDIKFLAKGEYGLRYINNAPRLIQAHQQPDGVDGDAYCLSGMQVLLNRQENPLPEHFRNQAIEKNIEILPQRLEHAIGKIVGRGMRESRDEGKSLQFMLIKNMKGADYPYDVDPVHAPLGKAGRQRIGPEQIVAWIHLDKNDHHKIAQGESAGQILIDKIVTAVAGLKKPGGLEPRKRMGIDKQVEGLGEILRKNGALQEQASERYPQVSADALIPKMNPAKDRLPPR